MLADLEPKAAGRMPLTMAEAERVLNCPDLVAVGMLGEAARKAHHGDRISYVQVLVVSQGVPEDLGDARELRLTGAPASVDEACAWVSAVAARAGDVPVTGFAAHELLSLAGNDSAALADVASALHRAGLAAVASLAIDKSDAPVDLVRALQRGGLAVPRVVIHDAPTMEARLRCIERVAALQADTSTIRAFAPLPEVDKVDTPSTGYDDVRTITVARLVCASVPSIQVDWTMYGPKLAQVAIAYGADDLDLVPALDAAGLGHRRSPRADIERQITAAFSTPRARDGRFEFLP